MADGLLQTFPGTFATGRTLPAISTNPLALQPGALLYIDPADAADPWAAGVPANGSTIKNLACWRLAELLNNPGLARYSDYQCAFSDQHQSANELKLERTGKGGLHGIPSQTNNGTANRGAYAQIPAALQAYLYANPNHTYFVGVIGNKTRDRAGTSTFPRSAAFRTFTSPSNTRVTIECTRATASAGGDTNGGVKSYLNPDGSAKTSTALGTFVASAASSAWAATLPTGANDVALFPFIFGNSIDNSSAGNTCHSWILYAVYVEDLTASGRDFATLQAQMLAQATTDFGAGGRYAGDTYTAPGSF